MRTPLTERLRIRHPVLLAPMGRVAGGALAAAVSRAGGLGLIGAGYGDPEWLQREFGAAGGERVGCGFITWSLARRPELLEQVLARSPAAVMLSFGDAAPFAQAVRTSGATLICQVQTLAMACEAVDLGADVIVAQGAEAGGHGIERSTLALVPEVADHLARVSPATVLVAAGGIADGRGLAAALMLGAHGVLVGSRFWASREALVAPGLQRAALESDGDGTVRTTVPDVARRYDWPRPFTARVLRTRFVQEWHGREQELARPENLLQQEPRFWRGQQEGNPGDTCVLLGEAVGLIRDVPPAGELVHRMVREAERLLDRGASMPA